MATSVPTGESLPRALRQDIERAGYYPTLVSDVLATALAGEPVQEHLVHQETTLDQEAVRRHITVMTMTDSRLVIAHADDHGPDPTSPLSAESMATATTETVPLRLVRGVMLAHVVASPDQYVTGSLGRDLTLTIGWGTISRVDLIPAGCADPNCQLDHGFEGSITGDDIALRISADADGDRILQQAYAFSSALSAAVGRT